MRQKRKVKKQKTYKRRHTKKQKGGISESSYQSHTIRITTDDEKTFTFYTDCKTDTIRNIKDKLLQKDNFRGQTLQTIQLLSGDDEMNDDQPITTDLNLNLILHKYLIGVFRNIQEGRLNSLDVSLPTQQERNAYEHAIKGEDDEFYSYKNAGDYFVFYRKENRGMKNVPLFAIADETYRRLGYHIIEFYKTMSDWFTIRSPYSDLENINVSDNDAKLIYNYYDDAKGPNQDVRVKSGWTFKQVNKLDRDGNIFRYKTGSGPMAYVVRIPYKNVLTYEGLLGKVLDTIRPYVQQR